MAAMRRTLAIVGLTALVAGIVLLGLWRSAQDVDPEQLHPPVDPAAWSAYLAQVQAITPPPERAVAPLLAAFAGLNRAEVASADPPRDPRYAAAAERWRRAAADFVHRRGGADFLDVGRRQGMRLAERLSALLALCDARGLSLTEALALPDRPEAVEAYIDVGGGFVRFAAEGGLLRDGRLVEERLPFVQALFIEHWVAPLRGRTPLDAHLWPAERAWLLRWRVEYQRAGSLEDRLAAADELRAQPDYPAHVNAGVLLYDAGRYAEAARRFGQSSHPRAVAYRRMAERAAGR